eukprot:27389-Eustigmatos_ZCMA.PRE.1
MCGCVDVHSCVSTAAGTTIGGDEGVGGVEGVGEHQRLHECVRQQRHARGALNATRAGGGGH